MNRLLGKVMLITESASAIGTATAKLASKEGAIVICAVRNLNDIAPLISEITQIGGTISAFQHDIGSIHSWRKLVTSTIKTYGKIDVLVNNAGISSPKLMLDLTIEDWNKIQEIDLNSFTYSLKEVIPFMINNNGGSIINVSSLEGLVELTDDNPYGAVKDVIRSLSLDAAFEYAKNNIRINSICPGTIETPMIETSFPNIRPQYKKSVQFPYLGKPRDIANSVIYLACDEASFITGAKMVIDGDRVAIE
ncbi:SDR family NAD(P)-dependent oxidoreductase [Enterococcus quebecensis]|uniref:SDR family oxidoreductase n=1 Tax=Enterococcus quebecensis TaxID=903983 RepID=A0A1E5H3V7_9ENTE|nr:SDR family oxidoreductase [Enterococcus quebecensis]OEG19582.1 SDR family oxidoreductase [Enterococcus quebecensis]OJG75139.1 hypothetical protein RV12_GL001744 [Enterococcus quebecensis]